MNRVPLEYRLMLTKTHTHTTADQCLERDFIRELHRLQKAKPHARNTVNMMYAELIITVLQSNVVWKPRPLASARCQANVYIPIQCTSETVESKP